jgi:cytochrome c5
MKIFHITLLFAAFAMSSCVVDQMEKLAPRPTPAMSVESGVSLTKLENGRTIFLANCGRCHEHQFPDTVSQADWHVVVPGMSWNAGISKNDQQALLSYLLAAKAKK